MFIEQGKWVFLRLLKILLLTAAFIYLCESNVLSAPQTKSVQSLSSLADGTTKWKSEILEMPKNSSKRAELLQFVEQLSMASKLAKDSYSPGSFSELKQVLSAMVEKMKTSEALSKSALSVNLGEFLENLSILLSEGLESNESPLFLIKSYADANESLAAPLDAHNYLDQRAYRNGQRTEIAHPLQADEAGDFADQKFTLIPTKEI